LTRWSFERLLYLDRSNSDWDRSVLVEIGGFVMDCSFRHLVNAAAAVALITLAVSFGPALVVYGAAGGGTETAAEGPAEAVIAASAAARVIVAPRD
jgi:hypothetical protein